MSFQTKKERKPPTTNPTPIRPININKPDFSFNPGLFSICCSMIVICNFATIE
jgi:hypothetical protein